MAMDLSAMQAGRAPQGWELAGGMFIAALGRTMDLLTPLVRASPAMVDLTVRVVDTGPAGATRLRFRDTGAIVFDGVRPDRTALTRNTIAARGLVFVIDMNRHASVGTGAVLQTLCHEYGGHACPWGDHLGLILAPQAVQVGILERLLDRAMDGDLQGGMQHLSMAHGTAGLFTGMVTAARSILATSSDAILADFDASQEADVRNLRESLAPLADLLRATSETGAGPGAQ